MLVKSTVSIFQCTAVSKQLKQLEVKFGNKIDVETDENVEGATLQNIFNKQSITKNKELERIT